MNKHHEVTPNLRRGSMFAVLAAMSSGLMLPLGKPGVASAGALAFLFEITFLAAMVGSPWLFRKGGWSGIFAHRKVAQGFFWHCGFSVVALALLWQGTSGISPAIAGFLSNTHVVFAVLLSFLVMREPIGRRTLAGGVVIVSGVLIMRGGELNGAEAITGFDVNWLLVIAAAAVFAMADLAIKLTALNVDMLAYLAIRNIVVAAAFGIVCWTTQQEIVFAKLLEPAMIGTAIFGIIGSRLFFNLSLQRISLSRSSLIFQVQPLFVALFSYLLHGELPQSHEWLGGLVIMSGVMLVLMK